MRHARVSKRDAARVPLDGVQAYAALAGRIACGTFDSRAEGLLFCFSMGPECGGSIGHVGAAARGFG